MNTTRKLSQEFQQFAIIMCLSATAHCAMIDDSWVIFIVTVTARVILAENIALSTEVAVLVLCAVIVAVRWREW